MDDFKYNVSVIVPIYNVEKFIARCVKSLIEQSLDKVEYIFIDDATPDNSIVILKDVFITLSTKKFTLSNHKA